MSGEMFLGLDLGTSGLRAVLVDESGALIDDESAEYGVSQPHPGWSEQDPADWLKACAATIGALRQRRGAEIGRVKGLGVAGHMHGATLLDAGGDVLRPCMLWNDTRAAEEAARLDAAPEMRAISGNIAFPGFTAPKTLWARRHEPELFARLATVLSPKDYLVYWLTGRRVSEMSDAAGTSWLDTGARAWSDALLALTEMTRAQMPELIEGAEVAGPLKSEIAETLGLPRSALVVGGGADNAAAACGVGAFRDGQGFVSLGTSGVLLAARDDYAPRPESAVHSFCHAVPGQWYQMGVILSATDSLNWLAGLVGRAPAELAEAAAAKPREGAGRPLFLPYLSGERTPHNDAAPRGGFIGLSRRHDAADLAGAVMEGVAFALRDCLEALRSTGARFDALLAIGGGAKSEMWARLLANTLDAPLDLPGKGDFGAAMGAARLAMVGAGGQSIEEAMRPPGVARRVTPTAEGRDAAAEAYARYRAAYPAVKGLT